MNSAHPYLASLIASCRRGFGLVALLAATALTAEPGPTPDTQPAPPANTDYRIMANDQLRFHITGEPEESPTNRVTSQGEISLPLLGAVKVAGLTLREAETRIAERYRTEGYFIDPQVILAFESYAPRTVSVLGQVNSPVLVDFTIERSQMGIVAAITRAGGFTRVARTDSVKVMRMVDGKEVAYSVNVAAYLNEPAREAQFRLLPDDIVFVPERVF